MEMGTNNYNSRKGFLATPMYLATQSSCTGHRHSFWFKKKNKNSEKQTLTIPPLRLPLPCQLGIVTEILLPRYIDFFLSFFFLKSVFNLQFHVALCCG